jgi:hypothetical protein
MRIRLDEFKPGDIVVSENDIMIIKEDFAPPGYERYITKMYHGYYLTDHPYDSLADWRNNHLPGTMPVTKVGHIYGLAVCLNCRHTQVPPRRWCPCRSIMKLPVTED